MNLSDEAPPKWLIVLVLGFALLVLLSFGRGIFHKTPESSPERLESHISIGSTAFIAIQAIYSDIDLLLDEIVRRESGGNPTICNQEFGCKAGMGLVQLIPSTVKYCEEKLGKSIDPYNAKDNLECGRWLLVNEGIRHWEEWSGPYN